MKPKILLATTCRWFSAARLAMAFAEVGCHVELVGPGGHPASKTSALRHRYRFRGLAPVASFQAAIDKAQPDLVLPCDDLSTILLHELYSDLSREGEPGKRTMGVLRRSLGPQANFGVIDSRSSLMELARSEGVRAPETAVVTRDSLGSWLTEHGFPALLKADGSAGGRGVQVVRTMAEAKEAFEELNAPPLAARAIKRAIFDQDRTLLKPCIQRRSPVVNAQVFVPGRDATTSVACWEGEIVALISVEVIETQSNKGPASVLRLIDHPEMSRAAEKITKRLQLSGFYGFDFMLEEQSNRANLIEMNARATQTCHLAMGTGRNLPVALSAMVSGEPIPETKPISDRDMIALFPQEWQSNPASHYLRFAYHDVPWREPKLVKACIDFYLGEKTWYSSRRLVELYRKMTASAPSHDAIRGVERDIRP